MKFYMQFAVDKSPDQENFWYICKNNTAEVFDNHTSKKAIVIKDAVSADHISNLSCTAIFKICNR